MADGEIITGMFLAQTILILFWKYLLPTVIFFCSIYQPESTIYLAMLQLSKGNISCAISRPNDLKMGTSLQPLAVSCFF